MARPEVWCWVATSILGAWTLKETPIFVGTAMDLNMSIFTSLSSLHVYQYSL